MSIRKRTLITAEIGPNHNGKIRYAEKIVKKLSKLDIDFIKFQFADPDEVYSLNSFKADYQIKNGLLLDPIINDYLTDKLSLNKEISLKDNSLHIYN